jgi:hypothetical protein
LDCTAISRRSAAVALTFDRGVGTCGSLGEGKIAVETLGDGCDQRQGNLRYLVCIGLKQGCCIIFLLPSTVCGGIRPTETADGGPLRSFTEEQYLIYSKQSLLVDSLDERQDST